MSVHFANSTLSFAANDAGAHASATPRPGALRRAVSWLVEMPRRRAVINELAALSDHELADIGLTRGDVPHVFKSGFVAQRLRG
jgi:uncharacterized protein YjiS (DUF1127 family)